LNRLGNGKIAMAGVAIICLVSVGIRWWFHDMGYFAYDQSRDAIVATQILQGDLKIFGPPAIRLDNVFHGVLYYYVLALFYFLGDGNPLVVNLSLATVSVLSLLAVYFLGCKLLNSTKKALLVTGLTGLSCVSIEASGIFNNLVLSILLLPLWAIFCYQLAQKINIFNSMMTGLLLGLLVQSSLANMQWILPVMVIFILAYKKYSPAHWWLNVMTQVITFVIAIASMIVVEFLMIKRGLLVLPSEIITNVSTGDNVIAVMVWFFNNLVQYISPAIASCVLVVIFILFATLLLRRRKVSPPLSFLILLLLTPIVFRLMINFNSRTLVGYESIFYIFLVLVLSCVGQFLTKYLTSGQIKILGVSALVVFLLSNFLTLYHHKINQVSDFYDQKADLQDKLQVIDYTYQQAAGKIFSIDVVVEPYGINTTYGYLYTWYGEKKYGYTPVFTGLPQAGYPSEGLLSENKDLLDASESAHFIIYERGTYDHYWFVRRTKEIPTNPQSQEIFYYRQPSLNLLKEEKGFGEITVEYYHP
jgi:4-amino-4-deoxy-L-arabinose transferase-like glycosyltransferase